MAMNIARVVANGGFVDEAERPAVTPPGPGRSPRVAPAGRAPRPA